MLAISNLRLAFALCIILLLMSSAAAFVSIQNLGRSTTAIKETRRCIRLMQSIMGSLKEGESKKREYIITGNSFLAAGSRKYYRDALQKLDLLRKTVPAKFIQPVKYQQLEDLLRTRIAGTEELSGQNESKLVEGEALFREMEKVGDSRKTVREMQLFAYDKLTAHISNANRFSTYAQIVIVFTVTLIIVITFFFYSRLERDKAVKSELERERDLMRKKDDFISIASHELKTPITGMKGYLQIADSILLREQNLKCHGFVVKANRQADKLTALVRDLLTVSKINTGIPDYHFAPFYLSEVIGDALTFAASVSDKHVIKIEGTTEVEVVGDKGKIEQVLGNLISNAIKYSPDYQDIQIKIETTRQNLKISVIDGGIGIPEKSIDEIFSRFYRVESAACGASGLGIGLYISKDIVERHHGELQVHSREGKGSTFSFTIPLRAEI